MEDLNSGQSVGFDMVVQEMRLAVRCSTGSKVCGEFVYKA